MSSTETLPRATAPSPAFAPATMPRPAGSTGPARHSLRFGLGLTAAFLLVVSLQLSRHQMWSDELNAWGLVLASPSLPALFHNLHYEGHPGLWHLLLWCASWLTADPAAAKVVHGLIATGVAAMIALVSPFSRLEKALLLLNYYVIYEYAVVSRNYGIALLLALIYAQLRATRPDRIVANGVVLGLLANTNVFGMLLSGAFAAEYMLDRLVRRDGSFGRFAARSAPAIAAYLALVAVAVLTLLPAPDISWRTTGTPLSSGHDLYALKTILLAYWEMPLLPALYRLGWQPPAAGLAAQLLDPPLLALPVVILAVLHQFRTAKPLLLIIGITAVASAAFGHAVYFGSMRHWGVNFVAVLAALWMQRLWRGPRRSLLVWVFLGVGAVTGLGASARVWMLPFSYAGEAARWIANHEPADVALIGSSDGRVVAVAIELRRPIHFLDCSCTDTFLRYHRRRDAFDGTQIPARLQHAMQSLRGRPKILILSTPATASQQAAFAALGLDVVPVAQFAGSQVGEDFALYRVTEMAR